MYMYLSRIINLPVALEFLCRKKCIGFARRASEVLATTAKYHSIITWVVNSTINA